MTNFPKYNNPVKTPDTLVLLSDAVIHILTRQQKRGEQNCSDMLFCV